MVYELRSWFEGCGCLYTDDVRVKDLAIRTPDLRIAASYYRKVADAQPFAWDIVGEREIIADIAGRFAKKGRTAGSKQRTR